MSLAMSFKDPSISGCPKKHRGNFAEQVFKTLAMLVIAQELGVN